MANNSRPSRRLKEEDSGSLKKKPGGGKSKDSKSGPALGSTTMTFGLRRSSRETPSKKKMSANPTIRKSERLEKRTPLTPAKRKLERGEKKRTPNSSSSLNIKKPSSSERGEKHRSSSSSNSKKPEKGTSSSNMKKKKQKKEENVKPTQIETREQSKHQKKVSNVVLKKTKRLDARTYRASFKLQTKKVEQSALRANHGRQDDLSQDESIKSGTSGLKKVEECIHESNVAGEEEPTGKCLDGGGEEVEGGSGSGPEKLTDGIIIQSDQETRLSHRVNHGGQDDLSQDECIKSGTSGSKKVEECIHKSNVAREEEPTGKCLDGGGEEVDGGSGSGPEKLADGIIIRAGREMRSSHRRKKRKSSLMIKNSKNGADSPLPRNSIIPSQSSPNGSINRETSDDTEGPDYVSMGHQPEAISDADIEEMDCPSREDLPISEMMLSTPEERLQSCGVDLETASEARTSKRKRNALDLDSDISVAKTEGICSLGTSSVEANVSSLSGSKANNTKRCTACFKQQSMDRDSENQEVCTYLAKKKKEVCTCSARTSHGLSGISLSEDRGGGLEDTDNIGITEECGKSNQTKDSSLDTQTDIDHNACVICKHGGKLLCCDGKGCSRSYHLSCLDPPVNDVPLGIWHCLDCVKKKVEFGVHSVSEGPESIWDAREVEASDCDGMQKETQYWVKYKGLAHVHNCWISERKLLHEAPLLITRYNKRHQKEQAVKWKMEWTVPQRLLQKRSLMAPKQVDEYFGGHRRDVSGCLYEWLVKWKGFGYEHATWELENATFLRSQEGKMLIRDYENRREKAKKASNPARTDQVLQELKLPFSEVPKVPSEFAAGLDNDNLNSVNKLCEYRYKCQNAIVIDEQERIMKVILFILSLQSYISRPFLIISSSSALPAWEDELLHLAPSVNVVVYSGNKDVRKCIRGLEFYENGGCVMFQVLISPPDAVVEDIEALSSLGWEAVIVDECQLPTISKHLEKIGTIISDFRLLLVNGQIKDSITEYRKLLTFLDSRGSVVCDGSLKNDTNDNTCELSALKNRFSCYILYERESDSSKFVEYWVPVRLSMVQLEQYCATLLENSISLRSCSKTDPVGALRDVLISTRKCCDHPYLVNPSLQTALTKGLPEVEYLDIGVNASGKLQLLDKILPDIKNRGLRVVILFQSIGGSGRNSIGDFLDDYMRQRFGPDSYERIDSGLVTSKRQASLNMFNNKERGRFVFLIENRACHPSVKLSSVDTIVIFDSDWNPLNDLKALQRINFDSQVKQLKVFRLYSTCTVEEKVLIFARQDMTLDSNAQNISRSTSHMLLIWGASYLFNRLDKFHHCNSPCSDSNASSEESLLNDVVLELLAQLPYEDETNDTSNCSVILKVKQRGSTYCRNMSLLGELELQLTDDEQPHAFWKKILEGRVPRWRYLTSSSQRSRKKVQYFDDLPDKSGGHDETRKKRKKMANIESLSPRPSVEDQRNVVASDKEARPAVYSTTNNQSSFATVKESHVSLSKVNKESGAFGSQADYVSQHLPKPLANMTQPAHGSRSAPLASEILESSEVNMVGSDGRRNLRGEQKNLYLLLKPEILKLCGILLLPEDVTHMAGKFLEYIINNHRVIREPETLFKAFQISLCWAAASFLKYKVDHKESLALIKQQLNFECKEEEVQQVYSKLRKLKKRILPRTGSGKASISNSQEGQSSAPRSDGVARHSVQTKTSKAMPSDDRRMLEGDISEISPSCSFLKQRLSAEQREPYSELANAGTNENYINMSPPSHLDKNGSHELSKECIRQIEKLCARRTKEMLSKQHEEIAKFHKLWERERDRLNKAHMLESDRVRAIDKDSSVSSDKLKIIDENFERQMDELTNCMENYQRKLVDMQRDARNREKRIKACWLEDAKLGRLSDSFSKLPLSESGFRMERMETELRMERMEAELSMVLEHSGNTMLMPVVSSVPCNVNAAISQPKKYTVAGGISDEAPVALTVPGAISAKAPVAVQNDVVGSMPLRTRTLAVHSSSMNVGSSNNGEDDNTGLAREVAAFETTYNSDSADSLSYPRLCQADLPSLDLTSTVPDHDNSDVAGVMQHSRACTLDDACRVSSPQSRLELLSLDQPQLSPCRDLPDADVARVDNYDVATSISSPQQIRIELPSSDHSSLSPCHDNSLASHQVPPADCDQPSISARGEREDVPSCEGQSSPYQLEVPTLQSADSRSPQVEQSNDNILLPQPVVLVLPPSSTDVPVVEHTQPDAPAANGNECELQQQPDALASNGNECELQQQPDAPAGNGNECELQQQPDAHAANGHEYDLQQQPDAPAANGNECELQHEVFRSSPQMEVVVQQADEALHPQTDQFTRPVSQAVIQSPMVPLYTLPSGGMPTSDPQVAGMLLDPTMRHSHSFPIATQRPQAPYVDPLQIELARLRREEENTIKMHEDVNNQLKAECERALEEVRRKYNGLIQTSDKIYAEKMNKLGTYWYKVSMNQKLAEAFRLKCSDAKPRLPPLSRGLPTVGQQFSSQSLPQTAQRPPAPPGHARSSSLFSSNPAPALNFSPMVPSCVNLQHGTELRAPAPHLQPFRPSSVSTPNYLAAISGMPSQQAVSNHVATPPQLPQIPPAPPHFVPSGGFGGTGLLDTSGAIPAFHDTSRQSALELLMDVDRPGTNQQNLLEISLDRWSLSNVSAGNGHGVAAGTVNTASVSVNTHLPAAVDVVCLSDDD